MSFSTENHVATAWESHGHEVVRRQENDLGAWKAAIDEVADFDMILWTRTGWQPPVPGNLQRQLLARAATTGVPTVGYHLDRWWGLNREPDIAQSPFFRVAMLVTADGGHDQEWEGARVNHFWLPPAVSLPDTYLPPEPRPEFEVDVAFVGSHKSYHEEWRYRIELVDWLARSYGDRFRAWDTGVREGALNALYTTAKVIVGDSCLAGSPSRYWSDRIPETIGRGGFLIHPGVEGLADHFAIGAHLVTYDLGDFGSLREQIDSALRQPAWRHAVAEAGQAHVREHHTYERRVVQVIAEMEARGLL